MRSCSLAIESARREMAIWRSGLGSPDACRRTSSCCSRRSVSIRAWSGCNRKRISVPPRRSSPSRKGKRENAVDGVCGAAAFSRVRPRVSRAGCPAGRAAISRSSPLRRLSSGVTPNCNATAPRSPAATQARNQERRRRNSATIPISSMPPKTTICHCTIAVIPIDLT